MNDLCGPTHQLSLGGRLNDLVKFAQEPGKTDIAGDAVLLLHKQENLVCLLYLETRKCIKMCKTVEL